MVANIGRLDAPGYIMGRDVTFSNVLPLIMEKDRLRDIRTILNYEKKKKDPSGKLQAGLTMDLGYCKIVFYCNVKLNYLLQRLTSFGVFPVDKFVKAP